MRLFDLSSVYIINLIQLLQLVSFDFGVMSVQFGLSCLLFKLQGKFQVLLASILLLVSFVKHHHTYVKQSAVKFTSFTDLVQMTNVLLIATQIEIEHQFLKQLYLRHIYQSLNNFNRHFYVFNLTRNYKLSECHQKLHFALAAIHKLINYSHQLFSQLCSETVLNNSQVQCNFFFIWLFVDLDLGLQHSKQLRNQGWSHLDSAFCIVMG